MATPVTRISVSLIPKTTAALDQLAEHTGLSKTDLVNRAVQLYDFVEQEKVRGAELALVRPDGSFERVRLL